MTAPLEFKIQNQLGILTLNRPDRLNALVPEMAEGFRDALRQAAGPEVKALLVRGEGRAFCAGGDIGWMAQCLQEKRVEEMNELLDLGAEVAYEFFLLPKPVIALVHGPAAGAGMSLALAADLRWASDHANFSMAFAKIGLHPDWGGSVLLSRLVSPSKAMELMWTGDTLTAEQALAIGLVNEVIPSDQFETAVAKKMARLAAAPLTLLGTIKQSAQRNLGLDASTFKSLLEAEGQEMKRMMNSPNAQEGIRAFLEKRPPRFS